MKLTSTWLHEWLRRTMLIDQTVVEGLEQAGIEIEQVTYSKAIDKLVVVCSVNKVVQHPGADKLKLVTVTTGESEYHVVCGAPNVREGIKVPFAQIGSVLPGGEKISRAKLRGELSEGMLCSARELDLGTDHNGLLELEADAQVGLPVAELFPADTIIDVKTPANRFDVQSVLGLAREVAAMSNSPMEALPSPTWKFTDDSSVVADKPEALRFALVKLSVDVSAPSPHWLQARLRAAGMRPVSLLVDITNFVMLDVGQPLHAYDAAALKLPFSVRSAHDHELLTTLDGVARTLSPEDLVITDAQGVVGLAGVMGGERTEVRDSTTSIWLEAAVFNPVRVRKSAKRYGLRTEASARFERGLPAELPELGLARAVTLLEELAGAKLEMAVSVGQTATTPLTITLPLVQLSKVVSFDIPRAEAIESLHRLQIETVQSSKAHDITIQVPWWRPDVKRPIDVAEEVVRVIGYDRVPARIPSWRPQSLVFDRRRSQRRLVRDTLFAAGLFEVMTYSFVAEEQLDELKLPRDKHLKLMNPLSSEQAFLRSGLLASHLAVAERNRTYAKELAFYEISNVFEKRIDGELPAEPLRLAITITRGQDSYRHLKGVLDMLAQQLNVQLTFQAAADGVYSPGRLAEVRLGDALIGRIGQLHPLIVQNHKIGGEAAHVELDLAALMTQAGPRQYQALNRFPVIRRDLSVWMPNTAYWSDIKAALADFTVEYIDEYYGEGTPDAARGLTLRITIAHPERTPTEAEADDAVATVLLRLEHRFKAIRRD